MKFKVTKASSYKYEEEIEINSLEELIKFYDKEGDLVFRGDSIIIYDDYLE